MPTLNTSTSPAVATRRPRLSTRSKTARAALALAVAAVLAACQPPSSAMPSISTARVNVPALPVPATPNLVLDAATFDALAAGACASNPGLDSATFFRATLGERAVSSLAGAPASLAQQRAHAGAAFVSGFSGGQDLAANAGVYVDTSAASPFAALSSLVNSSTTILALDQLVGQVLLVANSDPVAVQGSIAAMTPLLVQLAVAAAADFGVVDVPAEVRPLFDSIERAAQALVVAATAGVSGNIAAARQAETGAAALIAWAGGYFLGLTAGPTGATPSLTC